MAKTTITYYAGKRTLENELYPLANYLITCGIHLCIEKFHSKFLSGFAQSPELIYDWTKSVNSIDQKGEVFFISNLTISTPKGLLFFYMMDYYWCNRKRKGFDLLVTVVIDECIKAGCEIDIWRVLPLLEELKINADYILRLTLSASDVRTKQVDEKIAQIEQKMIENGVLEPKREVKDDVDKSTYLNLKHLRVINFKNIKDVTIDFEKTNGLTVIIGNNGCGKSNLLEAIASIFAGLYKNKIHKPIFDYELIYEINNHSIDIALKKNSYAIKVDGQSVSKTEFESSGNEFLPKNVIACYSGENQRLFDDYFWLYYKSYIDSIKKADNIPDLKLLYINKYCWNLALLTLFMYDFEVFDDIKAFCVDTLKIKEIKNITFWIDSKKMKDWNDNQAVIMVKKLLQYDGDEIPDCLNISLDEVKERLSYITEKEFFLNMYAACMPKNDKIITSIDLDLMLNNSEDSALTVDGLSEGEKKYLLMRLILEVIGDENSLLMFDEPDAHIHISRKSELKDLFASFPNRENIITTHSPTLAMRFDDSNIVSLGKDINGYTCRISSKKRELISEITNGLWNAHEQNMFLASNKKVILLVEGSTDKIHFNNAYKVLKDEYPEIAFDIFDCDGANNVSHLMKGLKTCSADMDDKVIIAIFDNDQEGKDNCNKTSAAYKKGQCKNKQNFYAITLPDIDGQNREITIENLYDPKWYSSAYSAAVEELKEDFTSNPNKMGEKIGKKVKLLLCKQSNDFVVGNNINEFTNFRRVFNIIKAICDLK